MNPPTPHHSRPKALVLLIVGLVLIIAPLALQAAFFLNPSHASPAFRSFMEMAMGPFFILLIAPLAIGSLCAYRGVVRLLYQPGNEPAMTDRKNRLTWTANLFTALIFSSTALMNWRAIGGLGSGDLVLLALIIPFTNLIMDRRLHPKQSWVVSVIGDPALAEQDERERNILNQAGRYTLAASMVLIGLVLLLLVVAPKPSASGAAFLLVTVWSIQRGLYGFFAWKLGLR